MSWQDRLREAAYTSPAGERFVLQYEDVRLQVTKRTAGFDFPGLDGTHVQDNGRSGKRYPLRLFFWGDDHDEQADQFLSAILERGVGVLEHPRYGAADVVPFGQITQRDDLKTAANQSIFEIVFWETTDIIYPSATAAPGRAAETSISEFNDAAGRSFADTVDVSSATDRSRLKAKYTDILDRARPVLADIAETQDTIRNEFQAVSDAINLGIDTLVAEPLALAFQTTLLIQTPVRIAGSAAARLRAYVDLTESLLTGRGAEVPINTTPVEVSNRTDLSIVDLYAQSYVTGSALSTLNTTFETRTQALTAAVEVLDHLQTVADWRDQAYLDLPAVDVGEAYQKLQEAVATVAGFVVDIAFTLRQERVVVLDRARTILDLSAELYGKIDNETLDFMITSNSLTGSEILELPRGRAVVYYV